MLKGYLLDVSTPYCCCIIRHLSNLNSIAAGDLQEARDICLAVPKKVNLTPTQRRHRRCERQDKEVITKLSNLHKKQQFALAIVAGNLFGEQTSEHDSEVQDLLDGKIEIPLPTYFSLGRTPLPSTQFGNYTDLDGRSAISYHEADILITTDWPESIRTGSTATYNGEPGKEVQSIANLCSTLKPKYHFSASPAFFEREPFFHEVEPPRPITRFISLAPYGNADKQKWIYAFSLDSSAAPPAVLPTGTTASPLKTSRKRGLDSQQKAFNSFRYSNGEQPRDEHRGKRRKHQTKTDPDKCYFCLSNPSCEAHMIASIGEDAYLTIAKGPLTTRDYIPRSCNTGHMLIIPLMHVAIIGSLDADAQKSTRQEMQKYRQALQTCVASRSTDNQKLGAVTWEISRAGGVHHHWQFLPVPADLITSGKVEAVMKAEAESLSYPEFSKKADEIAVMEEGNFFKVMVWSEGMEFDMVMPLDETFRFDLQFGRRVMGKLMKLESRTNWKDCGQSRQEEEADVARFKEIFKAFDFS
ncbi:hypothetical protein MRB53_039934 [Persea americana]|nr:hypothetical protein MRB53_039934 [Persea americana]